MRKPVTHAIAVFAILAVLASALAEVISNRATVAAVESAVQPNIILILTDDLDARLLEDNLGQLPNIAALQQAGTTFSNFLISTPLCCPSRSSILRGQYAHNHGVLQNGGENGGFGTFRRLGREDSTVATWLQAAGYRTALLGKYLNGYPEGADPAYVPPGWDEWSSFMLADKAGKEDSFYFDYRLNENGRIVSYGSRPEDYSTDVLSAKATDFVERTAEASQPFFLYLAPYAPHEPATPAPRHAEALPAATASRSPSFDEADVGDKPSYVRDSPGLSPDLVRQIDEIYRERLQSLLAVDEMVAALVGTLRASGQLDNTYVFFASDNGFHLGEHRLPHGKLSPYEEAIRVPLVVRGPGVPAGRVEDRLALNTDLAPTFAELAGAATPGFIDGRSLMPLLRGEVPAEWRQTILVEAFGSGKSRLRRTNPGAADAGATPDESAGELRGSAPIPPYTALRTAGLLYVEYETGERELYDLRADPYELENLAATADPSLLERLSARLAALRECTAGRCRTAEDEPLDQTGKESPVPTITEPTASAANGRTAPTTG